MNGKVSPKQVKVDADKEKEAIQLPDKKGGGGFFLLSFLFFAASVIISKSGLSFFSNIRTYEKSAFSLFGPFPTETPMINYFLSDLLSRVLTVYLLPGLLLAAGVFFLSMGLWKYALLKKISTEEKLKKFIQNRVFVIAVILILFALFVGLRLYIMGTSYYLTDGFAYTFQARILSKFRIFVESPQPLYSYFCDGLINNGKWYSKYTIGFPLILMLPSLLNLHYLVNPLIGVLCLVALFLLGRELFDVQTGFLAAVILLLSPNFILNNMPVLVHPSFLLCLILFLFFFVKSIKTNRWVYPAAAGFFAGFSLLIRPADFVFPALLFILSALYLLIDRFRKKKDYRGLFLRYLVMLGVSLVFVGILLYVNRLQSGNPFEFAFQTYNSDEAWGFGTQGHNTLRGIWNTAFNSARFILWGVPLLVELALISLFEKKRKNYFLFLLALCPVAFYFFYYSLGMVEFGTRFYHLCLAPLSILAARGLILLESSVKSKWKKGLPISYAYLIIAALFVLVSPLPEFTNRAKVYDREMNSLFPELRSLEIKEKSKMVILLRNVPGMSIKYYCRNYPDLNAKTIKLVFLDEKTNREAIAKYPDRICLIGDYDGNTKRWFFTPYSKDRKWTAQEKLYNLVFTSVIYSVTGIDHEKALEQIDKAIEISPETPDFYYTKAVILGRMKKFREAVPLLEKTLKMAPEGKDVLFDLAMTHYRAGDYEKSILLFEEYLSTGPSERKKGIVSQWLVFLKNKKQ